MACKHQPEMKTIDNKDYSIKIPFDMNPVKGLNKNAELQFGNLDDNLSLIVLREKIDDVKATLKTIFQQNPDINTAQQTFAMSFDGYCDMVVFNLRESSKDFKIIFNNDTLINNLPAKIYTYSGDFNNNTSYCKLAIYKGKTFYYQLFTFSAPQNFKENEPQMFRIITSLKE